MPDCVLDAAVVYFANGELAGRRSGNALDRRLSVIEQAARGIWRIRYNPKLLGEYQRLIQESRNDVIDLFFILLDSEHAFFVKRNTLSGPQYEIAIKKCRWPSHDQHLLAAALGGDRPTVFVSEARHVACAKKILARFAVRVTRLG